MIKEKILKKVENRLIAAILEDRKPEPRGLGYHFADAKWKVLMRFNNQVFYGGMYKTEEEAQEAVTELREFLHEVKRKSYLLGRD